MVKLEIEEGKTYEDKLQKTGGGYCLYFGQKMLEYLGITDPQNAKLIVKADKGKHGPFLGVGAVKEGEKDGV